MEGENGPRSIEKPRIGHIHVLHFVQEAVAMKWASEKKEARTLRLRRLLGKRHQGYLTPTNDIPELHR
jgi:hypothetical protein